MSPPQNTNRVDSVHLLTTPRRRLTFPYPPGAAAPDLLSSPDARPARRSAPDESGNHPIKPSRPSRQGELHLLAISYVFLSSSNLLVVDANLTINF
jgi:hypothetical protein